MKKIIYIFLLIFLVGCKDNSDLSQNLNMEDKNSNSSEPLSTEMTSDDVISTQVIKNEEFLEDSIPPIKSYTTTRKEKDILSENGEPLKQIKTDIISDLGYKIFYTDINYPLIVGSEKGIDIINTNYKKFIYNIEENCIKENLSEVIRKCNEEGCYGICYLYVRGEIIYKDNENISIGTNVSINTEGAYPYDLFYSRTYNLNDGKNLTLEDLTENSKNILENAEEGFKNRTEKDFYWIFGNRFDINKAQFYLSKEGITFCFDESTVPNIVSRLEYTVPKENIIFK